MNRKILIVNFFLSFFLSTPESYSQIIPDNTLPKNSLVNQDGQTFMINDGTARGNNLFHSFKDFSIPKGFEAFLNNSANIKNIFSRITGDNISNIDGLIRANGSANLFFINPNGIVFGENAKLDIGGSFLSSTANSIIFSDGTEFSATQPSFNSLLTISIPIGLNLGQNPKDIIITNQGHNFTIKDFFFFQDFKEVGLLTNPGKNLAFLGGNIFLQGGILRSNGGKVFVGAFANGQIIFDFENFSLINNENLRFKNILLTNRSIIDSSGLGKGDIHLLGENIELNKASVIFNQNFLPLEPGIVNLEASESIKIDGAEPTALVEGGIRTQGIFINTPARTTEGLASNIVLTAPKLTLEQGGIIQSVSFNQLDSGNITLNISETTELIGASPFTASTGATSNISSVSIFSGKAGDIHVKTSKFIAQDGAGILTGTIGTGNSGNILVKADTSVSLSGFEASILFPSGIASITGGEGSGGDITILTPKIFLENGGTISSSTFGPGAAGNIFIKASESVEIKGDIPNSVFSSQIASSASFADEPGRLIFRFPGIQELKGDGGSLFIDTKQLRVLDGANISTSNNGIGNGGELVINSNSLLLKNEGTINAASASGEGGNITINTEQLQIENNSGISTSAGGEGNGGNIEITGDNIFVLENSNISANAFKGNGGNINITADGVFVSPDSTITATSELGIDGTVTIETLSSNLEKDLKQSEPEIVDLSALIAKTCLSNQRGQSSLVRGSSRGIPFNPDSEYRNLNFTLTGVGSLPEGTNDESRNLEQNSITSEEEPIIPATKMIRTEDGEIYLIASLQEARELLCSQE